MIQHYIPPIEPQDIDAVVTALRHRHLSDGHIVSDLEEAIAARLGDVHVIAVSSGTAALYLSLAALGITREDSVIIPSYTCNSLYAAVSHIDARVICADSASDSLSVTKNTVEAARESTTRAVIAPHTCGCMTDIDAIKALGMPVIEDCAHAFGGTGYDGHPVGTSGDVSIVSFYATKLMPSGQGGACITSDRSIADRIRSLRDCDAQAVDPLAFNFRMSDVCAALAQSHVRRLAQHTETRAAMTREYDRQLAPWACHALFPTLWHVGFRYLVFAEGCAESFIAAARERGIECKRPIFRPLHFSTGHHCPQAETLHAGVVSIPMHEGLTDEHKQHVVETAKILLELNSQC